MPTYSDTGPTVIKEARVVGLPIVTTTGAGAACYVKEGESGFVTAPGDRDALAAGVTVTLETWAEMVHVFQLIPFLPETRKALAQIAKFVSEMIPAAP